MPKQSSLEGGTSAAELLDAPTEASTHTAPKPAVVAPSADDEQQRSSSQNDDPATAAASEELKHASISDRISTTTHKEDAESRIQETNENRMNKSSTPEATLSDTQDEEMRERLSSPKKKRVRDQDDDGRDLLEDASKSRHFSEDGSAVEGSKQTRLEPQKKRARDGSEDRSSDTAELDTTEKSSDSKVATTKTSETEDVKLSDKLTSTSNLKDKPQTSASAFASSGFASLAGATTSPFGTIGASKPSVFGGASSSSVSGFAALAGSKSPPTGSATSTSGFGALSAGKSSSGFAFGNTSKSGFGALGGGSAFGSALGNGFATGTGQKLSSFAAPGATPTAGASKPAKAFGAPDSDAEEGSDEEESDGEGHTGSGEDERASLSPEERKKNKPQRVQVEDGEAGEATLLHIRAKLFAIASKEAAWKERGVGTLKINVPQSCVSFDDEGHALPGTFDLSALEDADEESDSPRIPRLIMRQENTHRVILNTALLKQMVFKDKPAASSAQIYFTAIEGDKDPKPVNMLLKMNEANAELFRQEVASIQREL